MRIRRLDPMLSMRISECACKCPCPSFERVSVACRLKHWAWDMPRASVSLLNLFFPNMKCRNASDLRRRAAQSRNGGGGPGQAKQGTVAILAQGTNWADAATQAFL